MTPPDEASDDDAPITTDEVVAARRFLWATTTALALAIGLLVGVGLVVGVPLVMERQARDACLQQARAKAEAIGRGEVAGAEVHRGTDATVIVVCGALVLVEGGEVTATALDFPDG